MTRLCRQSAIIILIISSLYSCGVYRQNIVNTPHFTAKNQAQIGVHISFSGYDIQTSYSITNKIGLLANYSTLGTKRKDYSSTNYSIDRHYFSEFGLGYYSLKDVTKIREVFILAGQGMTSRFSTGGSNTSNISATTTPYFENSSSLNYTRFVLQADFGKREEKIEYSFSPRIFLINFYNIEDNNTLINSIQSKTFLWSDISLTAKYSFLKYFKINGQIHVTLPITGFHQAYFDSSPFNLSLGVLMNLPFHIE